MIKTYANGHNVPFGLQRYEFFPNSPNYETENKTRKLIINKK